MKKQQPDDIVILQILIDGFISLKTCLLCLGPSLTNICSILFGYGVEIDFSKDSGAINSIEWSPNSFTGGAYLTLSDANSVEDKEELEYCKTIILRDWKMFPVWVKTLHDTVQQLQQALDDLPDEVHSQLSILHGPSWRPLVRLECLDLISYWPIDPSTTEWVNLKHPPNRLLIPERMDKLLEYQAIVDPTPIWQEFSQKLNSYIDDVLAIRGKLNTSVRIPRSRGGRPKMQGNIDIEAAIIKDNLDINGIVERFGITADYARQIKSRMKKHDS